MQKRLCRRPEIFNDESIHYRIRSLCFCCHEMYTFIISPPRTESIVPLLRTTLNGKFIKRKNNKHTQIQTQTAAQTCILVHTSTSPRTANIHTMKYFTKPFHQTVYKAMEEMQQNDVFFSCVVQLFHILTRD